MLNLLSSRLRKGVGQGLRWEENWDNIALPVINECLEKCKGESYIYCCDPGRFVGIVVRIKTDVKHPLTSLF